MRETVVVVAAGTSVFLPFFFLLSFLFSSSSSSSSSYSNDPVRKALGSVPEFVPAHSFLFLGQTAVSFCPFLLLSIDFSHPHNSSQDNAAVNARAHHVTTACRLGPVETVGDGRDGRDGPSLERKSVQNE